MPEDYLELKISVIRYNGRYAIQLKKLISDPVKVNRFLHLAMTQEFIPAKIFFRDRFEAATKLREKGLMT